MFMLGKTYPAVLNGQRTFFRVLEEDETEGWFFIRWEDGTEEYATEPDMLRWHRAADPLA